MEKKDFDPRGQYSAVIDAVTKAGKGDIGYFKAEIDQTRSEYLVLIADSERNRLVGLKALAIES